MEERSEYSYILTYVIEIRLRHFRHAISPRLQWYHRYFVNFFYDKKKRTNRERSCLENYSSNEIVRSDSPINSSPDNFQVPLLVIIILAGQTFL